MKRVAVWLLTVCLCLSLSPVLASAGVYIGPGDLQADPEPVARNIRHGAFSFRGPDGWAQQMDASGALIVVRPDQARFLTVFSYTAWGVDFSNDAQRLQAYDQVMRQYGCTRYQDAGRVRYGEGDLAGQKSVIFLYGEGSDILIVALSASDGSQPQVSDLSPYTRTVIHD